MNKTKAMTGRVKPFIPKAAKYYSTKIEQKLVLSSIKRLSAFDKEAVRKLVVNLLGIFMCNGVSEECAEYYYKKFL